MEKLVTILEQRPVVARNYTAQDGTQKTFYSKGFILTDGIDEFYAEMTGDMARDTQPYDTSLLHKVQGYINNGRLPTRTGKQDLKTKSSLPD